MENTILDNGIQFPESFIEFFILARNPDKLFINPKIIGISPIEFFKKVQSDCLINYYV